MRTGPDATLEELAEHSTVPVLNMLTARHHPCQALADLLTLREAYGSFEGPTRPRLAYVGDGNNVARSLAMLGTLAGLDVAVASPPGYTLEDDLPLPAEATGKLTLHTDPREAVAGACAVYTDVWVSMGDEATAQERRAALAAYRLDDALLDAAAPGAFAMHDLPAHPGEEITAEVLYGARQRIWDQAENRRHAQKALLGVAPCSRRGLSAGMIPDPETAPLSSEPLTRPQRGDELELQIESLAFGGEGVARLGDGGYVVFVAGAVPGDRVRAVVHKRKRSYAHARTLEVLDPSPERIAPLADHPGVPWQVLPYERQLQIKRAQVDEALRRIGKLEGFELEDIVPALEPWRYRNKLEYSFGASTLTASWCAASTPPRAGTGWRRSRTACWPPSGATSPARRPCAGAARRGYRLDPEWAAGAAGSRSRGTTTVAAPLAVTLPPSRSGPHSSADAARRERTGPGAGWARAAAQPGRARRPAHRASCRSASSPPTASSRRARWRRR